MPEGVHRSVGALGRIPRPSVDRPSEIPELLRAGGAAGPGTVPGRGSRADPEPPHGDGAGTPGGVTGAVEGLREGRPQSR